MKKEQRGVRYDKTAVGLLVLTLLVIVLLSALLYIAIVSIDGADGEGKTSPEAPESLVSLGAPRSQLELERVFSSIADEYSENGVRVYEPVTASYYESIQKRINNGESFALSVEEVLYIISDSVEAYESFDVIRLVKADGMVKDISPIKDSAFTTLTYSDASEVKARAILEIILYRILVLSSPDNVTRTEENYVYVPKDKENGERSFRIVRLDAPDISEGIVFNSDNGEVTLYPTDKIISDCLSTVICESRRALSRAEREVLTRSGYDADVCRNVTPEYFYGRTPLRLVAIDGRILVVDIEKIKTTDPLPSDAKFTSTALAEDGIYITCTTPSGSAVYKYETAVGEKLVMNSSEAYVGAYFDADGVYIYPAKRTESKKYISVLVRSGDPIIYFENQKENQ